MRLVSELENKPQVLLENVKNLKTHDIGRTFSKIANIIQKNIAVFFQLH